MLFFPLLLALAVAAPSRTLIARGRLREANVILRQIQGAEFERALRSGLSPVFLREILAARFTTPADRAYLAANAAAFATAYRPRAFRAIANGYQITAPNGREFTVTAAGAVRVNGRPITGTTLESFAAEVHAALHRTFVTRWDALAPARAEATPIHGALTAVALIGYFVWRHVQSGGFPERVVEHFAGLAATCTAERREPGAQFKNSATARAFEELSSKEVLESASTSGSSNCDVDVERATLPEGATAPRFSAKDLTRACSAARSFVSCAVAFRQDRRGPTVKSAELIEKSSTTGQ